METPGNGYCREAMSPLCQIRAGRLQALQEGPLEREYRSRSHSIPVLTDVICLVR